MVSHAYNGSNASPPLDRWLLLGSGLDGEAVAAMTIGQISLFGPQDVSQAWLVMSKASPERPQSCRTSIVRFLDYKYRRDCRSWLSVEKIWRLFERYSEYAWHSDKISLLNGKGEQCVRTLTNNKLRMFFYLNKNLTLTPTINMKKNVSTYLKSFKYLIIILINKKAIKHKIKSSQKRDIYPLRLRQDLNWPTKCNAPPFFVYPLYILTVIFLTVEIIRHWGDGYVLCHYY